MYMARTRAPYVGLAAALGVVAIYDRRLRRPLLAVALVAILTLIVAWPLIMQLEFVKARLLERSPVYNRVALAATSLNMFLHKPLFGYGFGRYTFREEHVKYLTGAGGVARDYAHYFDVPHNEFLHILVLLGCAGFLPYVGLLVLAWRSCGHEMRNRTATAVERDVTLVALGGLVVYVANGLAADLAFCWYGTNLIFTLLGVVAGLRLRRKSQEMTPEGPRVGRRGKLIAVGARA
jgi:O-antigen ligase